MILRFRLLRYADDTVLSFKEDPLFASAVCLFVCLFFPAIVVEFAAAAVTHQLMTSGLKHSHELAAATET